MLSTSLMFNFIKDYSHSISSKYAIRTVLKFTIIQVSDPMSKQLERTIDLTLILYSMF